MRGTSVRSWRTALSFFAAAFLLNAGCTEFVHWGHVDDRDGVGGVNGVEISQKLSGGRWRRLGETDGKGKWSIFKSEIHGGGEIRLRKPGYKTLILPESQFLQKGLILMQSIDGSGYDDAAPARRPDDRFR